MVDAHETLEETLHRLAKEREDADRAYNDALTALDTALLRLPGIPDPPPVYDEQQITPLNQAWEVIAAPPPAGGLKGRLAGFVWRIVAPTLQKQQTFNSIVVNHVNRNVRGHRETRLAVEAVVAVLRAQVADLQLFHAHLLLYLQQITGYVDTKDRATGGRALVVNAAVNALAEELAKRWESLAAREQRFEAAVAGLKDAHGELRTLVGVSQQAALSAKREIERFVASSGVADANAPGLKTGPTGGESSLPVSPTFRSGVPPTSNALDSYKYVGFEDQFRGSQDTIRARLQSYLEYFESASDVLDVGCGRGEFLDLLQARGVPGRGIDLNHEMVEVCRSRGLDVAESDAVSYLDGLPDGSLGGLFAAQVVEHLQPAYLLRFLELAYHKLRPGAPIVLETLNPACWTAFFDSFIRDITHVWPLHPETLRYLVLASGFSAARIEFRSPVAPQDRLQKVGLDAGAPGADLAETFNANVEKLNARMFTHLDYAVVGSR